MDGQLLDIQEFNGLVTKWALMIKRQARSSLASGTSGSGRLSSWLSHYVDRNDRDEGFIGAAYKVAFAFERYGVFRAYGTGRGWVHVNGTLRRGFKARSESDIKAKRWTAAARSLSAKGYTVREVNRMKFSWLDGKTSGKDRKPLDWLDAHIEAGKERLAETAAEFYGDHVLRAVAAELDKAKIKK